jgi:ATP-dependent Lon protease
MFFKHKHLLEDLPESGRRATAEIISLKYKGGSVPAWYDPNDHSKVVVDYEADVAGATHAQQDYDRTAHRHDQRLGRVWTPVGGKLLPLEAMARPGKGRLKVAGQLGKVLNESAQAAVSYVRSHAAQLLPELDSEWFARHDIQIDQPYGDMPAGVSPEEWASTGLAVTAALVSLLCGRIVRTDVALTGKLASDGELLPVSGFKEKALAAKRDYAQRVVAPVGSEHDVREIPERQRQGLEFVFVLDVDEALRAALSAPVR